MSKFQISFLKKLKITALLVTCAVVMSAMPVSAAGIKDAQDSRDEAQENKEDAQNVLDDLEERQNAIDDLEERPNATISIFFDEGISDASIQWIGEQIRALDYVNTIDFVSADEAFDRFCEQNYDDMEAAKAALGNENPLKNAASYEVTLKDVSKQAEFAAFAKNLDGVRSVRSSEVPADDISMRPSLAGYVSIGIAVILMWFLTF